MPFFCDIHNHSLYGVDDGPSKEDESLSMIDMSYNDGVRIICFTPHYHPNYWGNNSEKVKRHFDSVYNICKQKYPDLLLFLGNELRYDRGCEYWISQGSCNKLGPSRYVLIDFSYEESKENIISALRQLLNVGVRPILAHAERYTKLSSNLKEIIDFHLNGVLIQVDTDSLLGGFGKKEKKRADKILKFGLCDIVSTDAHSTSSRKPNMLDAFTYICDKYSKEYAYDLCYNNAKSIFNI